MAELPDIPLDPIQGAQPVPDAIKPTDLSFGQAAQDVDRNSFLALHAMGAQARIAKVQALQQIQPQVDQFKAALGDQVGQDAPKWNGQTPGFALDQIGKARQLADRVAGDPSLTPAQRSAFLQLANSTVAEFGNRVLQHESETLAKTGYDENEVASNGAYSAAMVNYGAARQGLVDNYDGAQAGVAQAGLTAFDQTMAQARQSIPPALQPAFDARVSAERVTQAAELGTLEQKGKDAYVLKSGQDQIQTIVNGVETNPDSYGSAVTDLIPGVIAAMPPGLAGMKTDIQHQAEGWAAGARVRGLIDKGEGAQAQSELSSGKYDNILSQQERSELASKADAAVMDGRPKTPEQAASQDTQRAAAGAYALAAQNSPAPGPAPDISQLPQEEQARIRGTWKTGFEVHAAQGSLSDMTNSQLTAAATSTPPANTGDDASYATAMTTWKVQHDGAAQELERRAKDPALWAMGGDLTRAKGGAGAAAGQRGAAAQAAWGTLSNPQTDPATRAQAGASYAASLLGTQQAAGVARGAWRVLPEPVATAAAASVINATPETRMAALQGVASLYNALPMDVRLADGSHVNPRALMASELTKAHMTGGDVSALADFGSSPAALGQYVAARNDPTAVKPLPGGQEKILDAQVRAALQPELRATAPLGGAETLTQDRIDRTILIARHLVGQGVAPEAAAAQAAGGLTAGYRYVDTWRIPTATAANLGGVGVSPNGNLTDGVGQVRNGAANVLQSLTANKGANLYTPAGVADWGAKVAGSSRWVPTPDDRGLTLMVQGRDGTWGQVKDKWGRAQTYTFEQLHNFGGGWNQPSFDAPPASATPLPGQAPIPAASARTAFRAVTASIETQESGGRNGLIAVGHENDPDAPVGVRQMRPSTAAPYAMRIFGQPVDPNRLRNDPAYNRQLSDAHMADLIQKYGPTAGGLAIAVSAYYNGEKNTDQHLIDAGDPRKGMPLATWLAGLPPKTGPYTAQVLNRAFDYLRRGG